MFKINIKYRLIISAVLVIVGVFIFLNWQNWPQFFSFWRSNPASAGSTDNIRGFLWSGTHVNTPPYDDNLSGNLGWISLNCYNDYDENGKFNCCCSGGCGGSYCPSLGPDCEACPYGVAQGDYGLSVGSTSHKLTGYAWGNNTGWVCFGETCNPSDPPGPDTTSWAYLGNQDGLGDKGEDFSNPVNLISQWKFTEILGTSADDAIGTNDGTLKPLGSEPTWVKGKWTNALQFDGDDDYVETPNIINPATTNFTAEAWVKAENFSHLNVDGDIAVILQQLDGTGTGRTWLYIKRIDAATFRLQSDLGGSVTDTSINWNETNNSLLNKWVHVAVKYDGTNIKLYINGVEDGSAAKTIEASNGMMWIGKHKTPDTVFNYWKGEIDNTSIWTRAKTDSEIWEDAQMEISGWAKIINMGDDCDSVDGCGWIKLQKGASDPTPDKWWGSYLNDYNGFYVLDGYGWNSYQDGNIVGLLGTGWIRGGYPRPIPKPSDFSITYIGNTPGCNQLFVHWTPATWAEWYTYKRCQKDTGAECASCNWALLGEYQVLDGSCDGDCSVQDTGLLENTGYCYEVFAHNSSGDKDATNNPQWGKILPCEPKNVTADASICGCITTKWDKALNADGYNIYRSVTNNGCSTLTNSGCQLVGQVGEALDYDLDNNGTNDLVAQWKMNETWNGTTNEVKDSSNQSILNNGTAKNGAHTVPDTKFNRGGSFNSTTSDYVEVAHNTTLNIGNTFTFEAWINPTVLGNYRSIFHKIGTNDGYAFRIKDDKLAVWLGNAPDQDLIGINATISAGSWQYVAAVKNGTNLYLYVNGELKDRITVTDYTNTNTNVLTIGKSNVANEQYWNGLLDNLAIYNQAKSAEQIRIDYEAGALLLCNGSSQCSSGKCGLDYVCHINGVDDDRCGKENASDPSTCCYTDKRVTTYTKYYYVITATSESGESPGSAQKGPEATKCFPPPKQEEQ